MISYSKSAIQLLKKTGIRARDRKQMRLESVYNKYREFTMNPPKHFVCNLDLVERIRKIEGDIVECGVWRGGMIAGIAEILGDQRHYYLYDSFEGLPPAQEIDGQSAIHWQQDKNGPAYFDNCKAEMAFAQKAMQMADVPHTLIKGWFNETLPQSKHEKIALLRLDGDWYESTMTCLQNLYQKVALNGLIILDDYYYWEGCSKATHDFLSSIKSKSLIYTGNEEVAYIIKKDE